MSASYGRGLCESELAHTDTRLSRQRLEAERARRQLEHEHQLMRARRDLEGGDVERAAAPPLAVDLAYDRRPDVDDGHLTHAALLALIDGAVQLAPSGPRGGIEHRRGYAHGVRLYPPTTRPRGSPSGSNMKNRGFASLRLAGRSTLSTRTPNSPAPGNPFGIRESALRAFGARHNSPRLTRRSRVSRNGRGSHPPSNEAIVDRGAQGPLQVRPLSEPFLSLALQDGFGEVGIGLPVNTASAH